MSSIVLDGETSPFTPSGLQWAWNSTSIGAYKKCPKYYEYSIIRGLRKTDESVHLKFGGHYATALEHYHKHVALGLEKEDALLAVVHEAMRDTWDRDTGAWISNHAKNRETLVRSIIWYIDHWAEDNCELVHLADGKPAVELSFQFELDQDITLVGHLDRLVRYSGDLYVQDQKTTGSTISSYYWDQWSPSNQMSLYAAAGKVVFDTPVKGVMIDAAQVAVGFTRFERGFAPRTQDQIDEWLRETIVWVRRAQKAVIDGHFPHNDTSCHEYGGCAFREVCSKSPSVRESILKTKFHVDFFNPLRER